MPDHNAPRPVNRPPDKIQRPTRESYYAYRLLRTPRSSRRLAYWVVGFFAFFFVLSFLPWQQNIRANGGLTALSPNNRPQTINTAIDGQIVKWHVQEGQFVNAGDTIMKIEEIKDKYFDPQLLERLKEQIDATGESAERLADKSSALGNQYDALTDAQRFKLEQAENKVTQTRRKVQIDSANVNAARNDQEVAERRFQRYQDLFEQGLIPEQDLETYQMKQQQTVAKLTSAQNKYENSINALINAKIQLNSIQAEYADKLSKSASIRAETEAKLQNTMSKLAKMRNELTNMTIRRGRHFIVAPQSGYIVRVLKTGLGETIKAGEAVATIMPNNPDLAVEVFVRAMDVPLLSIGTKVRLQFDGWPALQVSGWPNVSVGTFGGKVKVIDYVNTKPGYYRVLVVPDPEEEPWPKQLRVGSGVYAWALLQDVPLWYEIWRQLNGFPPSLQGMPGEDTSPAMDQSKKPAPGELYNEDYIKDKGQQPVK